MVLGIRLRDGGEWDDQWINFTRGLTRDGIKIGNSEDSLFWTYDKKLSMITVKKSYELIVSENLPRTNVGILTQVWHFNIP